MAVPYRFSIPIFLSFSAMCVGCWTSIDTTTSSETDSTSASTTETESATEPTTVGPTTDPTELDSESNTETTTDSDTDETTTDGESESESDTDPVPYCGDGKVNQDDEDCDNGADNSDGYGFTCTTTCKVGQYCGDKILQVDQESCDEGTESNSDDYNSTCNASCTGPGPHCGDNEIQEDEGEECDSDVECQDCFADRVVFVTLAKFKGDLTLSTAETACEQAALTLGIPGNPHFQPWLGVNGDPEFHESLKVRFSEEIPPGFAGRFIRPDGEVIAIGWDGLSGELTFPISITEEEADVGDNEVVWSGVSKEAMSETMNCENWSNANVNNQELVGRWGNPHSISESWTSSGMILCAVEAHLYCFQTSYVPQQ